MTGLYRTTRAVFAGFWLAVACIIGLWSPLEKVLAQENADRPIKDKWAVIIGVSQFADKRIPTLKFPAKDAKDFADFLVSKANFAKDHVLLLTDSQATKVKILDAFGDGWLPRRAMGDDLVVIFISSHGSPQDVAGENFIIAYDSDPNHTYATGIRLQDLAGEVTKRTGCDRILVLLDACHSGAAVQGGKGLLRTHNFELESVTGQGQMVISSSKPEQLSWESKRYNNGVFTRCLIQALESNGAQTPMNDAYSSLKNSVEQEVRFDRAVDQSPMLLSKWKGTDLKLCAPATEPRKVLSELPGTELSDVTVQAKVDPPQRPVSRTVSMIPKTSTVASASVPPASVPSTPAPSTSSPAMSVQRQVPMMVTHWLDNRGDVTLESGTRLLTRQELQGLSYPDLLRLYNEAYARHGRGFLLSDLNQYFDAQPWYRRDPDYHWNPNDPKVKSRGGMTDDSLVVNAKRTPKQWANMMLIKPAMDAAKGR